MLKINEQPLLVSSSFTQVGSDFENERSILLLRKTTKTTPMSWSSMPNCGKCDDWYVGTIEQRQKRRDDATCRHRGGLGGHSPYGLHYAVCICKLPK